MPPNTSPQAQQFTKNTVPHTWQHIGKWNSDTQQIGNVKKIRKELFKFDDIDDDILTNAAFAAEAKLSSVKWKNNYNLCDIYQYWTYHNIVNGQEKNNMLCVKMIRENRSFMNQS